MTTRSVVKWQGQCRITVLCIKYLNNQSGDRLNQWTYRFTMQPARQTDPHNPQSDCYLYTYPFVYVFIQSHMMLDVL